MELSHNQEKSSKKISPLIADKRISSSSSPFKYQDTNYVGITINDELPHNKEQLIQEKCSSIPKILTSTITTTTTTTNKPMYSPIYQSSSPRSCSFSPTKMRFNSQIIPEENADWSYCNQPDHTGAFRKIGSQTELPLSYQQRLRERKRYGVFETKIHVE